MPTSTAHTEVPGEHGVFPPFQKETFASQLLWLSLTLVLLYVLMAKIALPRVGVILQARREQIAADLKTAEQVKDQSDAVQAANAMQRNDAHSRAVAIINATRAREAAAAEEMRKKLDAQLKQKIDEAENSIAGVRSAAMANIPAMAADAASAIVERLMGRAPAEREVVAAVVEATKKLECYRA
jgi:F-type H+-transporting ATPase subunit b